MEESARRVKGLVGALVVLVSGAFSLMLLCPGGAHDVPRLMAASLVGGSLPGAA